MKIDASAVRTGHLDHHSDWMIEIGTGEHRIPLADCRTTEQADLVLAMFNELPPDRQQWVWRQLAEADTRRPFSRIMRPVERA